MRRVLLALTLALACAAPAAGQQRTERFPEPAPERAARELIVERQSYWLEGIGIGLAAGIVSGILFVDATDMCTTGVPGTCYQNAGLKLIGTAGLGILGGFLGGMIGATIPRE